MTVGCEIGDDTYQVGIRDEARDAEANVVMVTVVSNPLCGSQLADLIAESVTVEPVVVRAGTPIQVRVVVRNAGASHAAATLTAFRLGPSPVRTNIGDSLLGKVHTPALQPGEATDVVFSGTMPKTMPDGTYYVWVIADQTSVTLESKSINNFASSPGVEMRSTILARIPATPR